MCDKTACTCQSSKCRHEGPCDFSCYDKKPPRREIAIFVYEENTTTSSRPTKNNVVGSTGYSHNRTMTIVIDGEDAYDSECDSLENLANLLAENLGATVTITRTSKDIILP